MRYTFLRGVILLVCAACLAGCGMKETPGPVEFPPGWPLPQLKMPPGAQRAFLADRTDTRGHRVYSAVDILDKPLSATNKSAVVNKAKDYVAGFRGVESEAAFKFFDDQMSNLGYSPDSTMDQLMMRNIRLYISPDKKSEVNIGFAIDDYSSHPRGQVSVLVFERPNI